MKIELDTFPFEEFKKSINHFNNFSSIQRKQIKYNIFYGMGIIVGAMYKFIEVINDVEKSDIPMDESK